AMNTGHDGSMTTLHANNPYDAVHRLELLAGFAGYTGSEQTLLGQIVSALQLMVHLARLPDGRRCVLSIAEIRGIKGHELDLREVFRFEADSGRHLDLRAAA
ncbi:MAG: ATPase, T2SS/T4P/T4SS family, partial [Sinobacteraceae bacterium]|nr:ATPase, T2SS/T4P/T4SS family [Nevskiaceae bacterium]